MGGFTKERLQRQFDDLHARLAALRRQREDYIIEIRKRLDAARFKGLKADILPIAIALSETELRMDESHTMLKRLAEHL